MTEPAVRLEREGDVPHVVLDGPPLNLFDRGHMHGLQHALDDLESARPKAAVLRAEGDVFSAGVDVEMFEDLTSENIAPFIAAELAGQVFDIQDFKQALRSFKEQGPGHAKFAGR